MIEFHISCRRASTAQYPGRVSNLTPSDEILNDFWQISDLLPEGDLWPAAVFSFSAAATCLVLMDIWKTCCVLCCLLLPLLSCVTCVTCACCILCLWIFGHANLHNHNSAFPSFVFPLIWIIRGQPCRQLCFIRRSRCPLSVLPHSHHLGPQSYQL